VTGAEINLKCKLRLSRSEVRYLKSQIEELREQIEFREKALTRATLIIERLDKNGDLWRALMGFNGAAP
jgi:5-bromo-4-chloroindolyl phosphate hydrolysis protein